MHYSELEHLSKPEFKRLCGVSRETFSEMVEVLRPHLARQGQRGGQAKLSVEDQLLVALEYWREYRSQFHIGVSWGVHETTVGGIVRKVEDQRSQVWQVPTSQSASALSTSLGMESDGGGRGRDRN